LNPFAEAIEVGDYIRTFSDERSRIAVVGSEPEIYFYAHRHSATSYIYTYSLVEDQPYARRMQNEMISEIVQANPEYLVFAGIPTSWLRHPNTPSRIFEWFDTYSRQYDLVGVADIVSPSQTIYRWNAEAAAYQPQSPLWLMVFKRKA
jgi:hypothetical protein